MMALLPPRAASSSFFHSPISSIRGCPLPCSAVNSANFLRRRAACSSALSCCHGSGRYTYLLRGLCFTTLPSMAILRAVYTDSHDRQLSEAFHLFSAASSHSIWRSPCSDSRLPPLLTLGFSFDAASLASGAGRFPCLAKGKASFSKTASPSTRIPLPSSARPDSSSGISQDTQCTACSCPVLGILLR